MEEKKPQTQTYGIRTNVILGFTIAFLAVVAAGYLTYESTARLLTSVLELSQPDQKLPKIRDAFSDLTEAENNMRMYALVKDETYFETYLTYIFRANKNIDTLKILTAGNEEQHRKVMQISVLLNTRLRNIDEFVVFKRAADSANYTWRALEKLQKTTPDTTRTEIFSQTTVTESTIDTVRIEKPAQPQQAETTRGFFGRIADFFTGKEVKPIEITDTPDQIRRETTITRDTSILIQVDTMLYHRIKSVLTELRMEEAKMQMQLFEKELELLKNNSMILSQIMEVIVELERDEIRLTNIQTVEAREVAGKSVLIISAVMLSSLFIILIFLFLILRAISRSNYLRNQLIIAKQKAEQLARVKEEFLATMSHEIRTPLNSIIGFSEQLRRSSLDAEQSEQLDAVKLSSEHLLSLVNDILDFSKIEQGKLRLERIPFTIEDVMSETYKTFRVRAREKGIRLGYHIESDGNKKLIGDPLRLKQVLFNLVGNAVKFTERGKVFVICRKVAGALISDNHLRLRFEVHDTGIGIQPDKLEAIFEGFTQADSSLSRKFGGTGLGLTISKKIIEMQDGMIGVASEAGKGSVFYFELSYVLADTEETGVTSETPEESLLLKDKYILLVDDDTFNIKLTTMNLGRWGVRVDSATSGEQALELIARNNYDLILTDIHMPDMSGIDLTQKIRKMPNLDKASVPIVAITANIMKDELDHYMKSGMDDYVLKPYRESDLFAKLADQLGIEHMIAPPVVEEKQFVEQSGKAEFDLSDVVRFSGGNKKAIVVILNSFITENRRNIETLEQNLRNNDYDGIAALAHKMLTSYGHLGVSNVAGDLRRLEKVRETRNLREAKDLISMVRKKSAGLFPKIQKRLRDFENPRV